MKILVTGGAGYIGSFMTRFLITRGHTVIVFDNLQRGYRNALNPKAQFIQGDLKNRADIESIFATKDIEAVMHFAGYISVEESTKEPELYFENNVKGSENLFEIAIAKGMVNKFIFSSTAAVYGNPIKVPIPESHPKNPTSPYGATKLETEKLLGKLREKSGINYACLRYFNAAGAALDGSLGENHNPETHLIPNAIRAALTNKTFFLYGSNYDTPDGTCVRDYIHVLDLAEAHLLALEKITKEPGGYIYNVGTGNGNTNKEVIDTVKRASGVDFPVEMKERRAGDADTLVADVTHIRTDLGFSPQYSDLDTIVTSAWKWHKSR